MFIKPLSGTKRGLEKEQGERSGANDSVGQILGLQKQWERKEKGYKGQIARLQAQLNGKGSTQAASQPTEAESSPTVVETKAPEVPPKHFVHNSDRYCTDCGGSNPEFKDETKCDGCGKPLGSIKGMVSLKACPDCGSTTFTPKRKLDEEELKLFAKA